MSEGRVFQNVGATTEKDLAPYVLKLKRGIERRFLDDERSWRDGRKGVSRSRRDGR